MCKSQELIFLKVDLMNLNNLNSWMYFYKTLLQFMLLNTDDQYLNLFQQIQLV